MPLDAVPKGSALFLILRNQTSLGEECMISMVEQEGWSRVSMLENIYSR